MASIFLTIYEARVAIDYILITSIFSTSPEENKICVISAQIVALAFFNAESKSYIEYRSNIEAVPVRSLDAALFRFLRY